MSQRFLLARIAFLVLAASFGLQAQAQFTVSGRIDDTFRGGGEERISGESGYGPTALLVARSGRIVYAAARTGTCQLLIGRLQRDGQSDPSFAGDGLLTLSASGSLSAPVVAEDVLHHATVVAATELRGGKYHLYVCRLLDSGSVDTSFTLAGYAGQNGCVSTDPPAAAPNGLAAAGVAVNAAGTILVGGTAYDFSDPTILFQGFAATLVPGGAATLVVSYIGSYNTVINGMAPDPVSGGLILVGYTQLPSGNDIDTAMIVARTGPSPGWANRVINVNAGYDEARAVAVRADGTILVTGVADVSGASRTQCLVYGLTPGLALDANYGATGGGNATNFSSTFTDSGRCDAIAVDNLGRAYIAGAVQHGGGEFDYAVGRLTEAGLFDVANFGDGFPGYTYLEPGDGSSGVRNEKSFAVGLQSGRVIIGGPSEPYTGANASNTDMVLMRLDEAEYIFANGVE
jgi:uncharacterized delta-60 repeat protein